MGDVRYPAGVVGGILSPDPGKPKEFYLSTSRVMSGEGETLTLFTNSEQYLLSFWTMNMAVCEGTRSKCHGGGDWAGFCGNFRLFKYHIVNIPHAIVMNDDICSMGSIQL